MTHDTVRGEVLDAAAGLVAAFGAHDADAYFGCFSPEATFLFHNHPELIDSRAAYEAIWRGWELEGFRVEGCRSLEPQVLVTDEAGAVFTHRVRTRLAGTADEQAERETMVFRRTAEGRWLVVHEHLSVDPRTDLPNGS
ncbi:conserved hypothetical protein [metagenome]|uniref:SnoaL-like domain-containing protein n=1 Tax=metagenome TaxID=256318 RepID=A0A2P2BYS9_9ZZZZ